MAVVGGIADPEKFPVLLKVSQTEQPASTDMEKYVLKTKMRIEYKKDAMVRYQKRFPER